MKRILVLKTDLASQKQIRVISTSFDHHPLIADWNVDTMDIDNVLRVEAREGMEEHHVIDMVRQSGFQCEILTD